MTSRPFSRLFPLLCAWALWTGCTTAYVVKVDAISPPPQTQVVKAKEAVSYRIKNRNPAVDEQGLRYKEAVDYLKTALSSKGLYEAPNAEQADMIVELDYGIEQPKVKMRPDSVPIYAQVGGGLRRKQVAVTDSKGQTSLRDVAVFDPPSTEIVGYRDVLTPVTTYEKYLRISARENKEGVEGRPPAEIWSVNLTSEDESKDLRKYLPLLASASVDYISKDSSKQKTIKIREKDEAVAFIKKGM